MGRGLCGHKRHHRAHRQCVRGGEQYCGRAQPAGVHQRVGVANAAAVLTGKTIGEGSRGRVQKVANTLLLFSVLVGVFNCLLVLVIRPLFLLLYNVTPETYEAAYTIIGVLACLQLVLGIDVTCIVGILRGGGDTRTAFVYDCGALWLVSIPMGILAGLVLHLPVPLVYVCLKLDSPIKAFLSLLRIRSGKWIRNVTVQTSPMPPEEEAQRAAGME
ncbi:MAG: MATE family efflux transporter [Ruthenibacterium lactatiformans]